VVQLAIYCNLAYSANLDMGWGPRLSLMTIQQRTNSHTRKRQRLVVRVGCKRLGCAGGHALGGAQAMVHWYLMLTLCRSARSGSAGTSHLPCQVQIQLSLQALHL
jgi:hypothetical protein